MLHYYIKLNRGHSKYSRNVNIYRFSRKRAVTRSLRSPTRNLLLCHKYFGLYPFIWANFVLLFARTLPVSTRWHLSSDCPDASVDNTCSLFCLRSQGAQASRKRWNEKFGWILDCVYVSESYEKTAWFLRVNMLNLWTENAFVLQVALPEISVYKYE
jgi:hypothetical protein